MSLNKMLTNLRYKLRALFTPSCWIQNYSYSHVLDKWYIKQLDTGKRFTNIDDFHATFCGYRIWITNHPYASFRLGDRRPSRATVLRLGDRLDESMFPVELN